VELEQTMIHPEDIWGDLGALHLLLVQQILVYTELSKNLLDHRKISEVLSNHSVDHLDMHIAIYLKKIHLH
jgi:hypothetical protein